MTIRLRVASAALCMLLAAGPAADIPVTPGQPCQPAGGGSHVGQWAVQFDTTGDLGISDTAARADGCPARREL